MTMNKISSVLIGINLYSVVDFEYESVRENFILPAQNIINGEKKLLIHFFWFSGIILPKTLSLAFTTTKKLVFNISESHSIFKFNLLFVWN